MNWEVLTFLIALAVTTLVAGPTAVWFLYMRPYIRNSGKYPATGAIWWYSQIIDFFTILAICREERRCIPWFIYVWGSITLFWLVVPVLLLVIGVQNGCVMIE